jgi:hypothetical protein
MEQPNRLDSATLRRLAVRASVCENTIKKAFEGQPIRGLAGHRARQVLEELGFLPSRPSQNGDSRLRIVPATKAKPDSAPESTEAEAVS